MVFFFFHSGFVFPFVSLGGWGFFERLIIAY